MLARSELDEAGKILISAADHIEKYGWWCKRHGASKGLRACLMTSIWFSSNFSSNIDNFSSNTDKATEAADRVTHYLGFEERRDAILWNDAPERTKEHVVEALREAAHFRD